MSERFVVLGLARVRTPWFADVARWANAASIPVDFLKCVSADELRGRLRRDAVSAVLADATAPDVDRGLFEEARSHGVAVLVVDDPRQQRDWPALGATGVLPPGFDADTLVRALTSVATPVSQTAILTTSPMSRVRLPSDEPSGALRFAGSLAAVCGRAGAGASTVAIALAQGLADRPEHRGAVLLADFALDAELGMYHDAPDRVPSVVELVDLHRRTQPDEERVRALTHDVAGRGYRLLLGIPHQRAWTTMSPAAVTAAIDTLRRDARWVVADVTADFEGEAETGSVDVEERNAMSRAVVSQASTVLVVGDPSLSGLRGLVRIAGQVHALGPAPDCIVPIVNRAPRSRVARREIGQALDALGMRDVCSTEIRWLPRHHDLETRHANVDRLPTRLTTPLVTQVESHDLRPAPVGVSGAMSA